MGFYFYRMFGLIWLICWLASYRLPEKHKKVSPAELAYINADEDAPVDKISWMRLLIRRETITLCLSRFFTDPVWWFSLWLPKFLDKQYGVSLTELGMPLITIYIIADLGGISGGWLSSHYIKKGKGVNRSRKSAMLICALCAAHCIHITNAATMGKCWFNQPRLRSTLRMGCKYIHACFGSIPKIGCRNNYRNIYFFGCPGQHAGVFCGWICAGKNGQLLADLHYSGIHVPAGMDHYSNRHSENKADILSSAVSGNLKFKNKI